MKHSAFVITAMTASLLVGTAAMASAQSSNQMNSSNSMKSGNMMNSNSNMNANVPMVGGAPMYPNKTIVQNASQAKNLTTLVAAVKAAGLVDTLSGKGPFTVFAPTNKAFNKLPKGTVQTLLKPENKTELQKILKYHVVPGKLNLMQKVQRSGGSVNLTTAEGQVVTVRMDKGHLVVIDKKGGGADIVSKPVPQSNGVVYVIDSVLMP